MNYCIRFLFLQQGIENIGIGDIAFGQIGWNDLKISQLAAQRSSQHAFSTSE